MTDNPLDPVAAMPTLDELFRKTKSQRRPEDTMALIQRLRERRAAIQAKRDGDGEENEDA